MKLKFLLLEVTPLLFLRIKRLRVHAEETTILA